MKNEPIYADLLRYRRNGLTEQVHSGIIVHINRNGVLNRIGNDNGYKFYHRSCMKPLQVSPLIDLGLDKKYNLSLDEIAVCCASHTGDVEHQIKIRNILKKAGFTEEDLLCPPHEPLSKTEQIRLIKEGLNPKKIHNNCSGKHSAMLLICKELGFDTKNYKDFENPLSDYIIRHVLELCETDINDVVISKDGCGLPVVATTLECLGRGFLNLFCNPKYEKIKNAFLQFPYLIGGHYRQDSEIIKASGNLIAKVGACGLCVVVNPEKEECIVVKIADSNMEARAIVTTDAILQLKWPANNNFTDQIKNIYCKDIISQDGDILGDIYCCFDIKSSEQKITISQKGE